MLDQRKVGKIILDIEQGFGLAIEVFERNQFLALRFELFANTFDDWKFDPKTCA